MAAPLLTLCIQCQLKGKPSSRKSIPAYPYAQCCVALVTLCCIQDLRATAPGQTCDAPADRLNRTYYRCVDIPDFSGAAGAYLTGGQRNAFLSNMVRVWDYTDDPMKFNVSAAWRDLGSIPEYLRLGNISWSERDTINFARGAGVGIAVRGEAV